MASLPKKGAKGANLRKWLIDSINSLIDYLHSARVRPGDGIMVKETPSGTIISLAKKETPIVNNTTGGGAATIGFPDLTGTTTAINDSNSYDITANSWLIGRVQSTAWSGADMSFYLNVVQTGSTTTPLQIRLLLIGNLDFAENFICLPIHSGLTISFTKDYIGMSSELQLYPCI